MRAVTNIQPHEGSNKNNHFTDKLCVAKMASVVYEVDFKPWLDNKISNPILNYLFKKT